MLYRLYLVFALVFLPCIAQAATCSLPHSKEVGHGRSTFMLLPVYDAALYAPHGVWRETKPFVLKIRYLRNLHGNDIARRSVAEMRNTGFKDQRKLKMWQDDMEDIFPDVTTGSVLSGLYTPGRATVFCEGGHKIGSIDDPAFGPAFFNIWLSTSTSDPHLRHQLLGTGS